MEIDLGHVDVEQLARNGKVYVSKKLAASPEVSWKTLTSADRSQFEAAMVKELDQVLESKALRAATKEETSRLGEGEIMQMRWLLTWKKVEEFESSTREAKARLVILGYQHPRLTALNTAAPTVSRMARHMFYSAVAHHQLTMESADASSAFLQSEQILEDQDLYVRPPDEVAAALGMPARSCATLAKVVKSFYGLTNAPRIWWLDISTKLRGLQFHKLSFDKCFWVQWALDEKHPQAGADGWRIIGVIVRHVDDFLVAGDHTNEEFLMTRKAIRELYRWGK